MISIEQVKVEFGSFVLFKDVSFLINSKDRIGLVGKNGAGKTTLLKIIVGEQHPSSGKVSMPDGIKIGYLPQNMICKDERNLFEEVQLAFSEIKNLEKEIKQLNIKISERTDFDSPEYLKLIHRLTEASERFELLGGNNIEADIEQTLLGLGFKRTDFERMTSEFSGGWRMRIELAKILLQKPNVLLLDEPTNHLDIEAIQWFEEFLNDYNGAVVMISHDRAFLDNITTRTIELSMGKSYDYNLAYSKYIVQRKEMRDTQLAAYRNQQKMIQETEEFIERFRYKATKAVQVQSRIKQLEKLERIEIDEEDNSKINIRFPEAPKSGQVVVEIDRLTKRYDDLLVLDDVGLTIEKGERISFVGRNGEGKTTLSRIIMGQLLFNGNCKIGHNVHIGYYAQNQDELLDEKLTVFQTLDDIAKGDIRTKLRDILGAFLFSGEDIDKKVKVLSGGERSRLALAKLLLEPYNLLVLDEPTNHLDMRSKDVLKSALLNYSGTLIVVSHDREFLDDLVDKVYEFRERQIKQHIGGIYNFLRKRKLENLKEIEKRRTVKAQKREKQTSDNKQAYLERKEFEKIIRKAKNKVEQCEKKIEKLEVDMEKYNILLATPENIEDHDKVYTEYQALQSSLEEEMKNWEQLHAELEQLESERK